MIQQGFNLFIEISVHSHPLFCKKSYQLSQCFRKTECIANELRAYNLDIYVSDLI